MGRDSITVVENETIHRCLPAAPFAYSIKTSSEKPAIRTVLRETPARRFTPPSGLHRKRSGHDHQWISIRSSDVPHMAALRQGA